MDKEEKYYTIISFFTYFVLLNTLLPISLSVTLEVCKVVQGYLIGQDVGMYSWERDKLVKCQTVSIVEDLGQIGYIFSDKTGTLTRNVMEFKFMLVGNEFYGDLAKFEQRQGEEGEDEDAAFVRKSTMAAEGATDDGVAAPKGWQCQQYDAVISGANNAEIGVSMKSLDGGDELMIGTQKSLIHEFMKVLSLAHMCVAETFTGKDGRKEKFYNGPSPDEVALVEYACSMDFDCIDSLDEKIIMTTKDHGEQVYPAYRKMDFNSDRKRMSVLLKDPIDGKIKLLIKGADSIIKERLDMSKMDAAASEKTEWFLDTASKQGLRTLLMAMKVVTEAEKDEFLAQCAQAEKDLDNREAELEKVYQAFERDL